MSSYMELSLSAADERTKVAPAIPVAVSPMLAPKELVLVSKSLIGILSCSQL